MRGIIFINDKHIELGEMEETKDTIYVYDKTICCTLPCLPSVKESNELVFSVLLGTYIIKRQWPDISKHLYNFGVHVYPYQKIERNYGAFKGIDMLTKTSNNYISEVEDQIPTYTLAKYCDFTFGIEYETSMGAIPEEECFNKGLIPLRDGSITGNEYATTVLSKNSGIFLIEKQMELLNKFTHFNKECALHFHFGNVPVEPAVILLINNMCAFMSVEFNKLLPKDVFHTDRYKKNGKNYCSINPWYSTFKELFRDVAEMTYFGDLYQPHPADPDKTGKWNVHSRYRMCNLVNMMCYKGPKTVEFRFLRPTKNIHVILFWLYILNALLKYAISNKNVLDSDTFYGNLSLHKILREVYPTEIYTKLCDAIDAMTWIRASQFSNGDNCGRDVEFESNFKLDNSLIYLDSNEKEC